MTRDEFLAVCQAYFDRFGEFPEQPDLSWGHVRVKDEELARYAQAAIDTGKPINWRDILGPTLHERDPMLLS